MIGEEPERIRERLVAFQDHLQGVIRSSMARLDAVERSAPMEETSADTTFGIDVAVEGPALDWLHAEWPRDFPAILVMEGIDDPGYRVPGDSAMDPAYVLIVDPVDGTRPLMYLKRPAWILSGVARYEGRLPSLEDIEVAAMTECPLPNHAVAEQFSAVRGKGIQGRRRNLAADSVSGLAPSPSTRREADHGFVSFFSGFPQGKVLNAQIEAVFYELLFGDEGRSQPLLFEDQYLSTGGQLYGLISGRDLAVFDLRPLLFGKLGLPDALSCHPYDMAALPVAREAGVVVKGVETAPLKVPLDLTSPVAWAGYANRYLADRLHPLLLEAIRSVLG